MFSNIQINTLETIIYNLVKQIPLNEKQQRRIDSIIARRDKKVTPIINTESQAQITNTKQSGDYLSNA